jgi:DNA-binding protein HU-beta
LNKRDLVEKIAVEARLTKLEAAKALNSFLRTVQSSLVRGERVTLVGFGTFAVSRHKARRVRDPRRGATIQIRARAVARFAPGLELKLALDNADLLHGPDYSRNSRSS